MRFLSFLGKQSMPVKLLLGFVSIGVVGLFDFWTGYEIGFSLFYVLPICYLAWFTSQSVGLVASFASGIVWLWADLASAHVYSSFWIPLWNTAIRLSFFVIIVLLLSALRRAIECEKALARIDNLTGAINARFFYEIALGEMNRLQRYGRVFSLAYLDLDNFKAVNDNWGHAAGDETLQVVASFIQKHIRRTDVLARLGGDEFAVLFPETDAAMVRDVCEKIHAGLSVEMQRRGWPVTFSLGVLTCLIAPPSVDELVSRADQLMYVVKHGTKNGIQYADYLG